jgi:ABC-type transporter Mla subunit MlaD
MSNLATQAAALRSALKDAGPADDKTRAALASLQNDLAAYLVNVAASAQTSESAIEHLEQIALRFEAEHPTVGAAVRQAIDTLVKAGI